MRKLIVLIIASLVLYSCNPYGYQQGCKGNRDMLTAGAGRTKFKK
jgi:hypothetical protein